MAWLTATPLAGPQIAPASCPCCLRHPPAGCTFCHIFVFFVHQHIPVAPYCVCILQPLPALRLSSQTVKLGMHISGIVSMFKGHVAHLVRHPCGAAIIDDVYHVASAQQRTAMVAELYGREFVLFSGEAKSITDFINELPLPKQKAVIRNMSQHAIPIMEKALVDSPLVHR